MDWAVGARWNWNGKQGNENWTELEWSNIVELPVAAAACSCRSLASDSTLSG